MSYEIRLSEPARQTLLQHRRTGGISDEVVDCVQRHLLRFAESPSAFREHATFARSAGERRLSFWCDTDEAHFRIDVQYQIEKEQTIWVLQVGIRRFPVGFGYDS
jgi:hypothetical protein